MTMAVIDAIFEVFSDIAQGENNPFHNITEIFWISGESGGGSLTFLGILAVVGLGISVIFLMMRVIQNFLHFRG